MRLEGRVICPGKASGEVLKSPAPLGFFGHCDPATGVYREAGHPLDGRCLKGKVLAFPRGQGSTVGSYILYALSKTGHAPAAMVLAQCDTIIAVGAIIASIPAVDSVDLSALQDGQLVRVEDGAVTISG